MIGMTRAADIYYKISPFSLMAIVMLNFLLIYMNLLNLENQSQILESIQKNTQIALSNQESALNMSQHNEEMNQEMLNLLNNLQATANKTFEDVNSTEPMEQRSSNLSSIFVDVDHKQINENLSSNVGELQTEVLRLRNQLEPRNISEAFPLYPQSSVQAPNNTYEEKKEGSIAGLNFSQLR